MQNSKRFLALHLRFLGSLSLVCSLWHSVVMAADLKPVATVEGFTDWVSSLEWSPDSKHLVCGSYQRMQVWSADKKEVVEEKTGLYGYVSSLCFIDGREKLLVGSYQRIQLVDTKTWKVVREYRGNRGQVTGLVQHEPKRFISVSDDTWCKMWDIDGALIKQWESNEPVTSVAISPDRLFLAMTLGDETRVTRPGTLVLIDIEQWQQTYRGVLHRSAATDTIFSTDGSSVLTAGFDEVVIVTDAENHAQTGIFREHGRPVNAMATIPGTELIVTGSGGRFKGKNELKIWELSSGRVLQSLEPHSERISCVAVSPDGKLLATGSHDKTVKIWDLTPLSR